MEEEYNYLIDGSMVALVEKTTDGFLVYDIYKDDEYGLCENEKIYFVKKIFKNPPEKKYSADIESQKAEIKQLEDKKVTLKKEIFNIKAQHISAQELVKERLNILKRHDQLSLLEDFINGRITHYVFDNPYQGIYIIAFDDKKAMSEFDKKVPRLLTLFGNSNGNLTWRLSSFSSHQDGAYQVIPCTSYEMALEEAQELIKTAEICENYDKIILRSAENLGLIVSESYKQQILLKDKARINGNIKSYQENTDSSIVELEKINMKLKDLKVAS